MNARRLILVRHGEAAHNVDRNILSNVPDFAIPLTEKGRTEAFEAGKQIALIIGKDFADRPNRARVYCSPYWRTRETMQEVTKSFEIERYFEHPALREQEWGPYVENQRDVVDADRSKYGHFYHHIPGGESCADVYHRLGDFDRDFSYDCKAHYPPETTVIISHSMTMRVLLMRLLRLTVEEFELLASPANAEYHVLEYENNRYELKTTPRKHENHKHPFQYDWKGNFPKGIDSIVIPAKVAIP